MHIYIGLPCTHPPASGYQLMASFVSCMLLPTHPFFESCVFYLGCFSKRKPD